MLSERKVGHSIPTDLYAKVLSNIQQIYENSDRNLF